VSKTSLVDLRRLMVGKLTEVLENAYQYDYGQRLSRVLLLVLTRETAVRLHSASERWRRPRPQLRPQVLDEIRYATAPAGRRRDSPRPPRRRSTAFAKPRRSSRHRPRGRSTISCGTTFCHLQKSASDRTCGKLTSYLQGHLKLDAKPFQDMFRTTTEQVQRLRAETLLSTTS